MTDVDVAKAKIQEAKQSFYEQLARKTKLEADEIAHSRELVEASEYENRIYTFDGEVSGKGRSLFGFADEGTVGGCIQQLGLWVRRDAKKPIKIIFNSPGGEVLSGLALFDYIHQIRRNGTRVDTSTIGKAASMGGILLQAGERRTISPNGWVLIHEVSAGAFGNVSEMKDRVKYVERLQDRCLGILSERSTLTKRQIKNRWERKDWWLDADEALEYGFVDEIA